MVTYAGLSAVPNPVMIGQPIGVTVWIWPIPPTISDIYYNVYVTITKPDGETETGGPFSSSQGFGFLYLYT